MRLCSIRTFARLFCSVFSLVMRRLMVGGLALLAFLRVLRGICGVFACDLVRVRVLVLVVCVLLGSSLRVCRGPLPPLIAGVTVSIEVLTFAKVARAVCSSVRSLLMLAIMVRVRLCFMIPP